MPADPGRDGLETGRDRTRVSRLGKRPGHAADQAPAEDSEVVVVGAGLALPKIFEGGIAPFTPRRIRDAL